MIPRYSRPGMAAIWTDREKYRAWLLVETECLAELASEGRIPARDWRALEPKLRKLWLEGGVDPREVERFEETTRHDLIAFTTAVSSRVGPLARYFHFGLTSSDVVDTALCLLIARSGEILVRDIRALLRSLRKQALRWRDLPAIGRSHGIFAEPTSFGLRFLGWYAEWERNLERLARALEALRIGKLSGAVGVSPHWSPAVERRALKRLGLDREPVSTQVIPRDRHAELLTTVAILGASIERIAVELRHLQRSEVAELREGFARGQKGSSAMPHKRNPISSENLTGCARLLRGYAHSALESVALWHERDISHSSVERVALPDALILLDYSLARLAGVVEGLEVDARAVRANLAKAGGTVFSGHVLLALVEKGASREKAYSWVQECALGSLDQKTDFIELCARHASIRRLLSEREIRRLGGLEYQLRHVPRIYEGVLGR